MSSVNDTATTNAVEPVGDIDPIAGDIKVATGRRKPNSYALFVKQTISTPDIQSLAPRDRFKAIARLWHEQKSSVTN
jgi:hypothetical protein